MKAARLDRASELDRLLHLSGYDFDYAFLSGQFGNLAKLAARIAGTEISLVNIIDLHTQWSIGAYGFPSGQVSKEHSICQYTILGHQPYEVRDMSVDDLFMNRFFVKGAPFLKYYMGIPLRDPAGVNVGALCVMDKHTRNLTVEQIELLTIIAEEIVLKMQSLRMHGELEQYRQQMESRFRKAAHDIRSPVGGIVSAADMLMEQGDKNSSVDLMGFLSLIHQTGNSVLELAEEILLARDGVAGQVSSSYELAYTTAILREKILSMFQIQAWSKGIELTINALDDTNGDGFPKYKLLQVVGNLISNAVKFTPKSGKITVVLHLQIDGSSKKLVIRVQDTGVGMTAQKLNELQSGRAQSALGTGGERGFAFGIALVKEMVRSLGGSFAIDSRPLEGTNVQIEIPY